MGTQRSQALEVAAELCKRFEGFSSTPYICPAGYPTQGYGTVYKPDGTKVTMEDPPITREQAAAWLLHELQHNYMAGVLKASPHLVAYPLALAALSDFAYNLGVPRYRASTLRRRVAENDWIGATEELKKWVRGGGRILPGLVKRRAAEAALL